MPAVRRRNSGSSEVKATSFAVGRNGQGHNLALEEGVHHQTNHPSVGVY
ncbi:hypothetical protein L914_10209 [Phytophthora nicotianae]|uniref:Uncharacterized protein n=2 Tax=Phytophthora nicotianae TaxID=4792 RepID=W2N7A9_PHYNI|nr:hypothetical protein L914_10209 [Phytophthora nicotianae]